VRVGFKSHGLCFFFSFGHHFAWHCSACTGATTTRVWAFYSLMALVLFADGVRFFTADAPFSLLARLAA
jgi:hypothetical protein